MDITPNALRAARINRSPHAFALQEKCGNMLNFDQIEATLEVIGVAVLAEREACAEVAHATMMKLCLRGDYSMASGAGEAEVALRARK